MTVKEEIAIDNLKDQIVQLRAMLNRLEWAWGSRYPVTAERFCRICGRDAGPHNTHAPDCALAALLPTPYLCDHTIDMEPCSRSGCSGHTTVHCQIPFSEHRGKYHEWHDEYSARMVRW